MRKEQFENTTNKYLLRSKRVAKAVLVWYICLFWEV